MSSAIQVLNEAAIERYSRQLLLRELGEAGQLQLTQAQVAVVGCGGLGVPAALYLGAAGVGRLTLIDPDRVALDNLNRQVAYRTDEVGLAKAKVLTQRILELNPTVEVSARQESLDSQSMRDLLSRADVVLECSDDPVTKFLVNDFCVGEGIGLVVGGAVGLVGQVVTILPVRGPAGQPRADLPRSRGAGATGGDDRVTAGAGGDQADLWHRPGDRRQTARLRRRHRALARSALPARSHLQRSPGGARQATAIIESWRLQLRGCSWTRFASSGMIAKP